MIHNRIRALVRRLDALDPRALLGLLTDAELDGRIATQRAAIAAHEAGLSPAELAALRADPEIAELDGRIAKLEARIEALAAVADGRAP
jgi:uncharacterized small protein (DUF1192 family)